MSRNTHLLTHLAVAADCILFLLAVSASAACNGPCTTASLSPSKYRRINSTTPGLALTYSPCIISKVKDTLPTCTRLEITGKKSLSSCPQYGDQRCYLEVLVNGMQGWVPNFECDWPPAVGTTPMRSYIVEDTNAACNTPLGPTTCADCQSSTSGDRLIKLGNVGNYYSTASCTSPLAGNLFSCSKFRYTGTKQAFNCYGVKKCFAQVQLTASGTSYYLFSHVCGEKSVIVETNNTDCVKSCVGCDSQCQTCNTMTGFCMDRTTGTTCTGGKCASGKCVPDAVSACPDCTFGAVGDKLVSSTFGASYYTSVSEFSNDGGATLQQCKIFRYTGTVKALTIVPGLVHCYAQVQLTAGGTSYWMFSHVCGQKSSSPIGEANNAQCGGAVTTCSDCEDTAEGDRLIFRDSGGRYYSDALWGPSGERSYTATCSSNPINVLSKCTHFYYTGKKRAFDCDGVKQCHAQVQLVQGGANYWLFSHTCGAPTASPIGNLTNLQCAGPPQGAYCWGSGYMGELGNQQSGTSSVPVKVLGDQAFAELTAGGSTYTCGRVETGDAYCFGGEGGGTEGVLGRGSGVGSNAATKVPAIVVGSHSFVQLSLGFSHACGVTGSGETWCWGKTSSSTYTTIPVRIEGLTATQVSCGMEFSCALDGSSAAWCWGFYTSWAYKGQMGNGDQAPSATPVQVLGGHKFVEIGVGYMHVCARKDSGEVWCWGNGKFGQCGNGQSGDSSMKFTTPVQVLGGLAFAKLAVSAIASHNCALTKAGEAYCWGSAYDGQLGNGIRLQMGGEGYEYFNRPQQVHAGGLAFVDIVAGGTRTCALEASGKAYCWGNGDNGKLGNGGTVGSAVPVAVAGSLTFSRLSAGAEHTCGIIGTPVAAVSCSECQATPKGDRRILPGAIGSYYTTPCASTPTGTLGGCQKFYYMGTKQAFDCGSGTTKCYAQVQLTPGGGGTPYWLYSHACGEGQTEVDSVIAPANFPQCGGEVVTSEASCTDCSSSSNIPPGTTVTRRIKPSVTGSLFSSTCAATPVGSLQSCAQFEYTGQKRAMDCGSTLKCYAEVQATRGGTKYWLFSHICGQAKNSVAGEANNPLCGGAATTCGDCVSGTRGDKLIMSGRTGSYYTSTCDATPKGGMPSCSKFFYTGYKKAVDCGGTKQCYAQVQLTPGGGGASYWLLSHTCGQASVVVDTGSPGCVKTCTGCDSQCQVCNPATGVCDNRAAGTSCYSGAGKCSAGKCVPTVKTCTSCTSECKACDTGTGQCVNEPPTQSCTVSPGVSGKCDAGTCKKPVPVCTCGPFTKGAASVLLANGGSSYYFTACKTGAAAGSIGKCGGFKLTGNSLSSRCSDGYCYAEIELDGGYYWLPAYRCGEAKNTIIAPSTSPVCTGNCGGKFTCNLILDTIIKTTVTADFSLNVGPQKVNFVKAFSLPNFVKGALAAIHGGTCALVATGQEINTRGMDALLPNSPALSTVLKELAGFRGSGLANMPVDPYRNYFMVGITMKLLKQQFTQMGVPAAATILLDMLPSMTIVANPCTQEFQLAFVGLQTPSIPLGTTGLTLSATLNNVGINTGEAMMWSNMAAVDIDTVFWVPTSSVPPVGPVKGNVYLNGEMSLALAGLDGSAPWAKLPILNRLKFSLLKAEAKMLLYNFIYVAPWTDQGVLFEVSVAPSFQIFELDIPLSVITGKLTTTFYAFTRVKPALHGRMYWRTVFQPGYSGPTFWGMIGQIKGLPSFVKKALEMMYSSSKAGGSYLQRVDAYVSTDYWGIRMQAQAGLPGTVAALKDLIVKLINKLPYIEIDIPSSIQGTCILSGKTGTMPMGVTIAGAVGTKQVSWGVYFCFENADCPVPPGGKADCIPDLPNVGWVKTLGICVGVRPPTGVTAASANASLPQYFLPAVPLPKQMAL